MYLWKFTAWSREKQVYFSFGFINIFKTFQLSFELAFDRRHAGIYICPILFGLDFEVWKK